MSQFDQTAPPLREDFVKLSPLGSDSRSVAGTNQIRIYEATGSFAIGINGSKPVNFSKGRQIKIPSGMRVDELEFVDTSGAENTIRYYYGLCEIKDDTLQVVSKGDLLARPDAAENLFDTALVAETETVIVSANSETAEVLAYNYGSNSVDILNSSGEKIDVLAAGEKARYVVTAGLNAESELGTDLLVSRFFF